ncbi:unnamed protein product, partial [Tetraodon nigroviridis]
TRVSVQVLQLTQCGAVKAAASPWAATSLLAQRRASEAQLFHHLPHYIEVEKHLESTEKAAHFSAYCGFHSKQMCSCSERTNFKCDV